MSKRVAIAAALLCLAGYLFVYATGRTGPPVRADAFSYFVYLPAWFIHGDPSLDAVARDCCGGEFPEFTAIIRWPGTGRWVNAHPIGVAVMQAPAFLAAHALTRWSNLSPDGFSLYYQHAAGLSGLGWTVAGLFVLRALLRRHFTEGVTAATLAALLLGTNLYHYATFDSAYSHAYSFFLFASLLLLTERWHERPSPTRALLLGLTAGLIVLVRHPNALFLLVFALYGLDSPGAARATVARLRTHWRHLLAMAAVGAAVVAPQLAIYYAATGKAVISSYGALGFNFASPHLAGVLIGVSKGFFFWSPLMLCAAVGLLRLRGSSRGFLPGGLSFLAINTYLIASWWDWQFGASFGHRGFVDALPLFSLGLAAFFTWARHSTTRTRIVSVVALALVALSMVQTLQYWNGILPIADTTWDQYRQLFLRVR